MKLESKFLGGLIGTALGDSIGELAFRTNSKKGLIDQVNKSTTLIYTDDTAMAIGLAEAMIKNDGEIQSEQLGKNFHANFNREPYRGYGRGPPTIFGIVERTGKGYVETAKLMYDGEGSFGNGASMRICPLGLYFHDYTSIDIYREAKKSAITTHSHLLGIDGAAVLAKAIGSVVKKDPNKNNLADEYSEIMDDLIDIAHTKQFQDRLKTVKDFLVQDVALDEAASELGANITAQGSVPFSIFAFFKNPFSFEDCLINTVLVSGDRDTVGAMVGGILGSYLGIEAIPEKWKEKLENLEYITNLAYKLFRIKPK